MFIHFTYFVCSGSSLFLFLLLIRQAKEDEFNRIRTLSKDFRGFSVSERTGSFSERPERPLSSSSTGSVSSSATSSLAKSLSKRDRGNSVTSNQSGGDSDAPSSTKTERIHSSHYSSDSAVGILSYQNETEDYHRLFVDLRSSVIKELTEINNEVRFSIFLCCDSFISFVLFCCVVFCFVFLSLCVCRLIIMLLFVNEHRIIFMLMNVF
jgi:hypothetical protein